MLNFQDLEIEKTIIPLFDFTNTERGLEELKRLFSEIPSTKEGVLNRQEILKALHQNWGILKDFNFKVIDCKESYAYCSQLSSKSQHDTTSFLKRALNYNSRQGDLAYKRSKLIQFLLLFDHLSTQYFLPLSLAVLPHELKKGLNSFASFREKVALVTYLPLIRQDKFENRHVLQLEKSLIQLSEFDLKQSWDFLFLFEAYFSIAKGMHKLGFTFPSFVEGGFTLRDFYHPLLSNSVKNSLSLKSGENAILLTGPNMSGKSTFFKSIGLCVYLAHIGVGVPALQCTIPFFSSITISINPKDNLEGGYSHFMQELKTVKGVILDARNRQPTFALFDELFKGTNPEDAQDILLETLAGLTQYKESFFFVSTHLLGKPGLNECFLDGVQQYYLDCQVKGDIPTFSYLLKPGSTQLKIGRLLFDQIGLKDLFEDGNTSY